MKKEKKLNMAKVKFCAIIGGLLLIMLMISIIAKSNPNKEYENLTVLFNNEFIETMSPVHIDEDENIYFSKEDIALLFDENIYYNEAEEELITTYNKHVALLKLDQEYGLIDDENTKLKGKLQEKDELIYIPITDLQIVYDLEIKYSPKSNRVIMESTTESKKISSVIRRTELKEKKGLFSSKKENLIIGDKVVILEEDGNYKKVRTPLGNIGYIKTKRLSEETVVREKAKKDKKAKDSLDSFMGRKRKSTYRDFQKYSKYFSQEDFRELADNITLTARTLKVPNSSVIEAYSEMSETEAEIAYLSSDITILDSLEEKYNAMEVIRLQDEKEREVREVAKIEEEKRR